MCEFESRPRYQEAFSGQSPAISRGLLYSGGTCEKFIPTERSACREVSPSAQEMPTGTALGTDEAPVEEVGLLAPL